MMESEHLSLLQFLDPPPYRNGRVQAFITSTPFGLRNGRLQIYIYFYVYIYLQVHRNGRVQGLKVLFPYVMLKNAANKNSSFESSSLEPQIKPVLLEV